VASKRSVTRAAIDGGSVDGDGGSVASDLLLSLLG
jgi:hypothetical protein